LVTHTCLAKTTVMSTTPMFGGSAKSLIGLVMCLRSMGLNCMLSMSMGPASNVPFVTWTNHENGRVKRGLYVCELTGIKINADLNAARNIAKRVGYEVPMPTKILSHIVTTNGVKPLTPKEGKQPRPPQ